MNSNPRFEQLRVSLQRVALLCAIGSFAFSSQYAQGYDNDIEREINADPAIQREIAAVGKATNPQEFDRRVNELLERGGKDRTLLLEQLLYHAAVEAATNEGKMLTAMIVKRLDFGMPLVVRTYAPHLDNKEPAIVKLAREWLIQSEDRSAARKPDFTNYLPLLTEEIEKNQPVQFSLVEHMYVTDPGLAMLTMMRAYQLREPEQMKPILWTDHVVEDLLWKRQFDFVVKDYVDQEVVTELGRLAGNENWWARLYVANIITDHPDLADRDWADALTRDNHELVRESAERWRLKIRPTNQ